MSTRCNIVIKDKNEEIILYHHCDGYPEGVGKELKTVISQYIGEVNPTDYSIVSLANAIMRYSTEYEHAWSIAGDIEYLYVIEIDDIQILFTCYDVPACEEYNLKTLDNCKEIESFGFINTQGNEIPTYIEKDKEKLKNYCIEDYEETIDNTVNVMDDAKELLNYVNDRNRILDNFIEDYYNSNGMSVTKSISKQELKDILKHIYDYAIINYKLTNYNK